MAFLTKEAARALRLDQKPDGKNILFKVVAMPGQYVLHYILGKEEHFRGISTAHLARAFGTDIIDSGWLPAGVYRWGKVLSGEWMVRFYPATSYTLQFGMPEHKDSFSLLVHLPGIVFAGIGNTYYVWAIKDHQLSQHTPLFVVPLSNIWGDGRICYGNNSPPAVSSEKWETIEEAWQLFIASPFIGDLANNKSRTYPQDIRLQLAQVAHGPDNQYPLEDLVPHTINGVAVTVEQAVAIMVKSRFTQ